MRQYLIILCITLTIFSCKDRTAAIPQLTVIDFARVMDSLPDEQLIDVRTPEECAKGIIAGAAIINFHDSDFETQVEKLDKKRPVMVYCRSGRRSATAATMMRKNGFAQVYDLEGGTLAWYAAGKNLHRTAEKINEEYTTSYFDSLLQTTAPVVVDFYAPWCAPCKRIAVSLETLHATYGDQVKIIRINIDDNPEFAKAQGIDNLPVLRIYKNGKKVWEKKSEADKAELEEQFRPLL